MGKLYKKMSMVVVMSTAAFMCMQGCGSTSGNEEKTPQLVKEFVIYGVDLETAPEIGGGDWINVCELGITGKPDSHFTGVIHPYSGIVASNDASLLFRLAPDANTFIVDQKEVSRSEMEKLTNNEIMVAALCDSIIMVNTYPEGLEYNPVLDAAVLEENAVFCRQQKGEVE